jgi:serine protease Do
MATLLPAVCAHVAPAVVGVATIGDSAEHGSGVLLTANGMVATEARLVRDARLIQVSLADGRRLSARLVGTDSSTDLALLATVGATGLPFVGFAPAGTTHVGDVIVEAGAPFGLDASFAVGIIAADGRSLGHGPLDDYLQIDANLTTDTAGSPVFDVEGRIIGLVVTHSPRSVDIAFAVPSEEILAVLPQIAETGKVVRGSLGLRTEALTPLLAHAFGVQVGALIADVAPKGPAARVGIAPGDVVTSWGGSPIEDAGALDRAIAASVPGATVAIELWRGGKVVTLTATVGPP